MLAENNKHAMAKRLCDELDMFIGASYTMLCTVLLTYAQFLVFDLHITRYNNDLYLIRYLI